MDTCPENLVQAKPYEGIKHQDGSLKPQPFIMFVDDYLMADTRSRTMHHYMAASFEALIRIM